MKLKEMMERRTAGKWLVHGDKHTLIHADDGRQMLAETLHGWDYRPKCKISLEEAQANAAYIAHCANHFPAVVEALADIELRTTQARLAHDIGCKSAKKQVAFLLGELERIATTARIALAAAEEVEGA
jgi:hypothetical protein